MNKKERLKERIKIIMCSAAALLLLAFVFYMALFSHSLVSRKDSQGALKELKHATVYELLESGKTEWKYLDTGMVYTEGENALSWTELSYDASSWKSGRGSFGAVAGKLEEQVNSRPPRNLLNHYQSNGFTIPAYYFRTEFEVTDTGSIKYLLGKIQYDDSAILYLNGKRVYTINTPDNGFGEEGYGAKSTVNKPVSETFVISNTTALREGKNVLSIELHQANQNSSDIYFDLNYLEASSEPIDITAPMLSGLILETGNSESQIHANWITDQKGSCELLWREKTGTGTNTWNSALMGRLRTGTDGMYTYNADMNGLLPDREYEYKVNDIAADIPSEIKTFRTGNPKDFSFAFAGDPQIGSENAEEDGAAWRDALDHVFTTKPDTDFLITAGDQVDSSKEEDAMQEFLAFRMPQILKKIPTAINRGNHEAEENGMDYQFERFSQSSLHDYYFTYGDTLFYALNTNNKAFEEHIKRLEAAIDKTSPRWVVVTMHYSMFGGKDRSDDSTILRTTEAYAKTFSRLNVDLVLSGHDHFYSRSFFMNGQNPTGKETGNKLKGEVMYLSGGTVTGSKYYKKSGTADSHTAFSYTEKSPTITVISINDFRILLETYRLPDMHLIDQGEIKK